MKILAFSWEYPPRVVGGLARHVQELYRAMAKYGDEVHVITCGSEEDNTFSNDRGVNVHRVSVRGPRCDDFVMWVTQLSFSMLEKAMELLGNGICFDIVHVHDWLAAYPGITVKHGCKIPLICTVHATEWGRNSGLHTDQQRQISDIEWYMCYEAWKVIVCSSHMSEEVSGIFGLPKDKIEVLPNGVEANQFADSVENVRRNGKEAFNEPGRLILYVGRLVPEKGVQVLLDAMPTIIRDAPDVRLAIVGTGPAEDMIRSRSNELGIADRVHMYGFVEDEVRNELYAKASVAVVPSLYEPFGITALEAMAAKVPLVTSNAGGLDEIVKHEFNGLKFAASNVDSLAHNVLRLLTFPELGEHIVENAYKDVTSNYDWSQIASKTIDIYRNVIDSAKQNNWYKHLDRTSDHRYTTTDM